MNIARAQTIDGWMEDNELEQLATWASQHHNILELGPWHGRSTMAICDNTNGYVTTVDHWEGSSDKTDLGYKEVRDNGSNYSFNLFSNNLFEHINSGKLTVVRTEILKAAKYFISRYDFEYFDMIFIDAGHESYQVYKRNLVYYLPLLKCEGLICGHDYTYPGARQALDELLPRYEHLGNIWWRNSW